ncbi:MAG: hypothetical protein H0W25_05135 [Acidimicrobiia bacterium]|nr:hypothetical protein [Acidimicrobiia bacterium]
MIEGWARSILAVAVAVLLLGSSTLLAGVGGGAPVDTRADPLAPLFGLLTPTTASPGTGPGPSAPDPSGPGPSGPPTPTTSNAPTTTASPTTTAGGPTTTPGGPTTTAAPPTTVPGSANGNPTGLTRARITIDSQAAWVTLDLRGMTILTSRVFQTFGNARMTSLGGQDIDINGDGRAVFDVVLSVAPGAATGISMCKNYLGPATVTVARLTDGEAGIATFTNSGSNTTPIGGCENPGSFDIDRSALVGPVRWPARHDPRPLVLANYYPWFESTRLGTNFGDQPVGPADTSNPAQVAEAIALAANSGIDGFIVEFERSPDNEPRIDEAYNAADRQDGFDMAMMLDFDIIGSRSGWITPQILDSMLAVVAQRASHSSQLRVGRDPVVFLYGTARLDPAQWSNALDRLFGATGMRLFVVSDSHRVPSPGIYEYSSSFANTELLLQQWSSGTLLERHARPGLVGATTPLWVAPVSPGYDDTRLDRPNPYLVDRAGGLRYDQSWEAAVGTLPDWIMITSWNEYYEQTHVMPGHTTGMLALEQTAEWAAQFHATG